MRTSAKILRTIGRALTWSGWAYAAPRHYGPWAYLGAPYYLLYRLPERPDPTHAVAALHRPGG